MVKYRWICRQTLSRLRRTIHSITRGTRLLFLTLCYNIHVDKYYVADTAMEPLFWVVDHFIKIFGPLFVTGVCLLITSAVAIAYIIGIPYWWHRNLMALIILFIIGHWLLLNIVFHYAMATITSPGHLPTGVLIPEAVSFCKKCIAPKPPRTHHCSVCNRCILKMDHHCPWLNNCIGHYNHRYFFLFMVYMIGGVIFLIIFGYGIVYEHLWPPQETFQQNLTNSTLIKSMQTTTTQPTFQIWMKKTKLYHNSLMYLTFLSFGVLFTLGGLATWHALLISKGQTSVEALINKAEKIRCKKEKKLFVNPYDFGPKENWRLFLGLHNGRNWWHIILPSWHKPIGSGLQWTTVVQYKQEV